VKRALRFNLFMEGYVYEKIINFQNDMCTNFSGMFIPICRMW
jgi:hypothetical protein